MENYWLMCKFANPKSFRNRIHYSTNLQITKIKKKTNSNQPPKSTISKHVLHDTCAQKGTFHIKRKNRKYISIDPPPLNRLNLSSTTMQSNVILREVKGRVGLKLDWTIAILLRFMNEYLHLNKKILPLEFIKL